MNPSGMEFHELCQEVRHLRKLVKLGESVVLDFLPNIGQCALQDYGALNTFLIEAAKEAAKTEVTI